MVEQFVGTWILLSSENFDEYMKAIGMDMFNYFNSIITRGGGFNDALKV